MMMVSGSRRLLHLVPSFTLLVLLALSTIQPSNAFSSINSLSNTALQSRLQNIQAELLLSIGRIPGTAMPPEWAASGAKLGFALEVEFTNEQCDYEMTKERLLRGDALMGDNLMMVAPLNTPSFVSANGQEAIKVESGAYGCQIQGIGSRQYAFRFFLDFPEGATRNDVELPSERIYFLSSCWLLTADSSGGASLDRARRRREEIVKSIRQIKQDLEEMEQRSASGNIFQKAKAFRDSIDLVERRGRLTAQLDELEQTYPLDSAKIIQGPNDITFAKEGVVAVKRLRGTLGTKEQYHWVGTFRFNEFFDDDDEEE